MAAIEALIMVSCMGLSGNANEACRKALEARDLVGETGMSAGAIVAGTGKAIVDRSANLKFPVFTPGFFLNLQIGVTKNMAGIEWKF